MTEVKGGIPNSYRDPLLIFIFLTALALAADLRLVQLDARPLHSDEAVNHLFVGTTNTQGYYPYSHENYHGPLYFYLITGLTNALGDGYLGLRSSAIIPGVLTVAALAGFAALEGWSFVALAAALAALCPSLVFFSRYAIHESLLLFESLVLALCVLRWRRSHHPSWWYLAATATAALAATKESFPIILAALFFSVLALGNIKEQWQAVRAQTTHIFLAYLLFVFLVFLVFTGGFRWPDGIGELVAAIPQWVGRSHSDEGHFKPFLYYLRDVLWPAEPQLVLGFAAALAAGVLARLLAFVRGASVLNFLGRKKDFALFTGVWTAFSFLVYSTIKYKTVWLVINVTLPATLFLSVFLLALLEHPSTKARILGTALTLAAGIVSWQNTLKLNFVHFPLPGSEASLEASTPYGRGNPFSYVHTLPGTLELVKEIKAYWEKNPNARVLVGVEGYFPLPYYLRERGTQCGYFVPKNLDEAAKQYDILIVDHGKHQWSNPDWTSRYDRLSDYSEATTYFRKTGES